MVVALVLTYLIHPLDASSSYSFFWFVSSFSVFLFFFVWIKFPSMVINLLMIYVFLSWLWSWIRDDDDSWRLNLCCFPSDYDDDDDDSFSSIFNLFIYYSFLPYIINFEPKRKKKQILFLFKFVAFQRNLKNLKSNLEISCRYIRFRLNYSCGNGSYITHYELYLKSDGYYTSKWWKKY